MKSLPVMNPARLCAILAQVALIFYSSTPAVAEASQYAFSFYLHRIPLPGTLGSGILQILAQKGVHFLLFFSLGTWLTYSLKADRLQKLLWTVGFCFLVGLSSEAFQFFVGRQAAASDILLNTASGALAAALALRSSAALTPERKCDPVSV